MNSHGAETALSKQDGPSSPLGAASRSSAGACPRRQEGGNGAGKQSQGAWLAASLRLKGWPCVTQSQQPKNWLRRLAQSAVCAGARRRHVWRPVAAGGAAGGRAARLPVVQCHSPPLPDRCGACAWSWREAGAAGAWRGRAGATRCCWPTPCWPRRCWCTRMCSRYGRIAALRAAAAVPPLNRGAPALCRLQGSQASASVALSASQCKVGGVHVEILLGGPGAAPAPASASRPPLQPPALLLQPCPQCQQRDCPKCDPAPVAVASTGSTAAAAVAGDARAGSGAATATEILMLPVDLLELLGPGAGCQAC